MVDEAHERSISTDILLGLLKKVPQEILKAKKFKIPPPPPFFPWIYNLFVHFIISYFQIQRRRPELRLIISSATIEAKSMSAFFQARFASKT